ncbi:MAG TPA: PKD domain-containing protein [Chloroflexi bacterium]|nr:PKD domain-containing protein [Chloroflexota bacterium]
MLRDGLEDYEYLYVLAGGQPQVDASNDADAQAAKIITGLTSYTRDDDFIYNLRRLIGLKNGGEIADIPDVSPPATHPRAEGPPGNYYVNFQDPAGEPSADPLIVDGREYLKIGWADYDNDAGYGWYSSPDAHWMTQYLSSAPNLLQASILYSDWGRPATFEFDLPNGDYDVTVSVGWQGRSYAHNYVEIEGAVFVDDEAADPYLVRTERVTVRDRKLTMAMGIFNEYTMLNYLDIEAAPPTADFHVDVTEGDAPHTVHFTDTSTNGPTTWAWDFDDDGAVDATEQHPTHTYTKTGVYAVRLHVTGAGGSDELLREDYISVRAAAVRDLRVTHAITGEIGGVNQLTVTLQWTPLSDAVTTSVRYCEARITEVNWGAISVPTGTLMGDVSTVRGSGPYTGGARYFALKSQDAGGTWSPLSNVAFWPAFRLYLQNRKEV